MATVENVTIEDIKKGVLKGGGVFYKELFKASARDVYFVNGRLYSRPELIEAYRRGDLKEPGLLINGRPEPGAVVVGQHGKGDDAMVWVFHPDGTYTTEHQGDVV